jgi:hypothetical protein
MIEAPILAATVHRGSTMGQGYHPRHRLRIPSDRFWPGQAVVGLMPARSGIFFSLQLTLIARWDRGVESPHQGRPLGDIPPMLQRWPASLEARRTHNVAHGGSRIAKLNRGR